MLASRGRNHGTRKSLSEMSLAEIYKAADGRRRPEILSKVFDPSMLSAVADWLPNDPDDLENLQNLKHAGYHALGSVSAALQNRRDSVNQHNHYAEIASHPNRRPLARKRLTPGHDFVQGAVDTARKWAKPGSISEPVMDTITNVGRRISGPVMGGINNFRQRIGF